MKNAKKFDVKMLAIWLIILAVFVAIALLLPVARNAVFYIAFAMTLVSFALVAFAYVQSFLHDDTLSSKLLGFPIFRVSVVALGLQLVAFVLLTVLSFVCPVWLAVLIEGLVLAGTSVCLIATEAARGVIEDAEVKLEDRTQTIKKLRTQAVAMVSMQEDAQVKAKMEKLAQELRYCDPVSTDATKDIELELEVLLGKIQTANREECMESIKHGIALVKRRNSIAKINK